MTHITVNQNLWAFGPIFCIASEPAGPASGTVH